MRVRLRQHALDHVLAHRVGLDLAEIEELLDVLDHALLVGGEDLRVAVRIVEDVGVVERAEREALFDDRSPPRSSGGKGSYDLVSHVVEGALGLDGDVAEALVPEADELVVAESCGRGDAGDQMKARGPLAGAAIWAVGLKGRDSSTR